MLQGKNIKKYNPNWSPAQQADIVKIDYMQKIHVKHNIGCPPTKDKVKT